MSLATLQFTNRFANALPADSSEASNVRQVYRAAYSKVRPTPVSNPEIIAYSKPMATLLDLCEEDMNSPLAAQLFAGNQTLVNMTPYAACYGGHQFGNWAGQLGDGRAIALGEVRTGSGEYWELQLKGAGPTPYSRMADGRAVLRSSIREFLCSEAMHHLGIPTTRALCLSKTGDSVVRDMFYSGHPEPEIGAICARVSPSFIRFGNFEIFAARNDIDNLKQLTEFTIQNYFHSINTAQKDGVVEFFDQVCQKTAQLMVQWMGVGFVHGVMNTDNMSILGLTIDYGPYGWIEPLDFGWTPNTTDAQGRRYAYGNQPDIGMWNLSRLAQALYPLIEEVPPLQHCLDRYRQTVHGSYNDLWAKKLGFEAWQEGDEGLCQRLNQLMVDSQCDFTLFYRQLSDCPQKGTVDLQGIYDLCDAPPSDDNQGKWEIWFQQYQQRLQSQAFADPERSQLMNSVNPQFVLRNWVAQLAIDASNKGDEGPLNALLQRLERPYESVAGFEEYEQKRPEWARNRAGCSMLSCSS
ncbi:MAG: protein adenylyltransferase SelO [Myxococcota bacterium]